MKSSKSVAIKAAYTKKLNKAFERLNAKIMHLHDEAKRIEGLFSKDSTSKSHVIHMAYVKKLTQGFVRLYTKKDHLHAEAVKVEAFF